ncbi:MAG: hypothetical protein ACK5Q5_19790 [Planctomycetaceae bacterium]
MEDISTATVVPAGRAALCDALRRRAQEFLGCGARAAARESITASIPLDPTPASRYFYAELLADDGELPAAIAQLEHAWELARRIGSPRWRAHCCHALAELQRERGSADLSNRYRQLAIRAELDAGVDVDAAVWLHDRAADAVQIDDVETADACLQSAERIATDDLEVRARIETGRGVVSVRRGRWSQGVRWFVRAFQSLRKLSDAHGCAAAVLRVGYVLQMQGEWRRGANCFQQAARSLSKLGAPRVANNALNYHRECLGMLAALHGDPRRN